jgi:Tol biopolymer transport system component
MPEIPGSGHSRYPPAPGHRELVWVDRHGKHLEAVTKPGAFQYYALSPDTKRIIINPGETDQSNFWLQDLGRGTLSRFTFGAKNYTSAVWSPDGSRIIFGASPPSSYSYELFQKLASGAGNEETLAHAGVNAFPNDWAPDGKSVVYEALAEKTDYDLWILPLDNRAPSGAGIQPVPYLQTPFREKSARFSPDQRWMAYESDESGQFEIYVQTIPASGAKWQVSTAGGRQPSWRRDGKELFYIAGSKLMAVTIRSGPAGIEPGKPEPLFEGLRAIDFSTAYQPAPDGQRFLVSLAPSGEESAAAPVTVVLGWQAGLKK